MLQVLERASAALQRQSVAALSIGELTRHVRESGTPISQTVLLRALAAEPDRFRVLRPWRTLTRRGRTAVERNGGIRRSGEDVTSEQYAMGWDTEEAWILPFVGPGPDRSSPTERKALRRLRSSLVGLGWALDATSSRDLSRWAGMVLEGETLRRTLTQDQRALHPED